MRHVILCVLAAGLITATTPVVGEEKALPPSKESYVKVRVEVEMQGILTVTEKAITIAARDRVYNLFNDAEEISREGAPATVYTLDFVRAKDLRERAKTLDGKQVVVTGMSELRMVVPRSRPGGETGAGSPGPIPSPTWSLQRTVEVTSLKSAPGK